MALTSFQLYRWNFRGEAIKASITFFICLFVASLLLELVIAIIFSVITVLVLLISRNLQTIWKLQLGSKGFVVHFPFYSKLISYKDIKMMCLQGDGKEEELLVYMSEVEEPLCFSSLDIKAEKLQRILNEKIDHNKKAAFIATKV